MAKLKQKLREKLLREMRGVEVTKDKSTCYTSVFSETIMAAPFPNNFRMLNITSYDGKGDQAAHAEVFCSWIDFERVLKLARCQASL